MHLRKHQGTNTFKYFKDASSKFPVVYEMMNNYGDASPECSATQKLCQWRMYHMQVEKNMF